MRRTTVINLLILGGIIAVMILLQVVFYTDPRQQLNESERSADRSTYTSRTYGLRAFYLLLEESGYNVSRFREPYTKLAERNVKALVIVVPLAHLQPSEEEFKALYEWIKQGGQVLIVDREVVLDLEPDIEIRTNYQPENPETVLVQQPTPLTRDVNQPRLTIFSTRLQIKGGAVITHLGDKSGAALAEIKYGAGRILLLSDPYVLANNGLLDGDNLQLALNLVRRLAPDGALAFDEYHHGYGMEWNRGFVAYFSGTPVMWLIGQMMLLTLVVVYSKGRRLARPVPLRLENRASSLEFVGSMAQLQQLAHATDLPIENIYPRFRHRLCRYAGLPTTAEPRILAEAVARRGKVDEAELSRLLMRCEEVLAGAPLREPELLQIIGQIRRWQGELGL